MDLFQRAQNPWGQDVLIGISWSLFWIALAAGLAFGVFHLFFRRWNKQRAVEAETIDEGSIAGVPEKVKRHGLPARLFHWTMALSMLVLLATGFLPKVGLQFAWVSIHWITGVVLILCILFHIVHATFFQSLRNIWISFGDFKEWLQEMRHIFNHKTPPPPKPGKYKVDHKLYHHAVTVCGLGVIVTGVLMMFRIETAIFVRNPYLYSDETWGWIYVIHGLTSVGLVTLTITHIYFAILPEKRWMTWSMIYGWISRRDFAEHHSPKRWKPTDGGSGPSGVTEKQQDAAPGAPAEAG